VECETSGIDMSTSCTFSVGCYDSWTVLKADTQEDLDVPVKNGVMGKNYSIFEWLITLNAKAGHLHSLSAHLKQTYVSSLAFHNFMLSLSLIYIFQIFHSTKDTFLTITTLYIKTCM